MKINMPLRNVGKDLPLNEWLERYWIFFVDSKAWRRFARVSLISKLFRSNLYQKFSITQRYVTTYHKSHTNPTLFEDVKTFCMFIGHTKSGGSLIGSLLDAHPDIILADEADVLKYMVNGFSRDQIYHILLKISRREALKGRTTARRLKPYSFTVPDQWQGRYRKLQVIGDSRAGLSTQRFGADPDLLLEQLHNLMPEVDVKFIHVIRNPYDPISQMMIRGNRTFQNACERYFANCEILVEMQKRLNNSNLFTIKYEEFVHCPETNLIKICNFLGLEADNDYVDACQKIIYKSPERSRHDVQWNNKSIDTTQSKIYEFDFLKGYTFDN